MPPSMFPDDTAGDGAGRAPLRTERASTDSPPDPLLGATIDGIRIVRKLGEGGFAFVYEGRQRSEPTVVAVKVLKPRLATPGLVRRFEYEAEILTRLVHPGIARVHRLARTSVDGVDVPCIVMEIVPAAKPITKYAGDSGLAVPDRLELLAQAAEAIGHGHLHGVLHRDVKPGNILVGPDGRAKVIDYGWARGLDSAAILQSAGTAFGQFVGTFQYMSPEQFDPDPAGVDIRADVWALGAVLQELLTGKPPHEYRGGPLFHFAAAVREQPPAPLPTHDRHIDRQLRAIVGRCLDKDRRRRYPSAADLAADLRRHLAGEPIAPPASAGLRESLLYLARKHAAAATAVAVSLAALVAATVGIGIFSLRTERALRTEAATAERLRVESRRATDEADRAAVETARARRQLYVANLHRLALPDAGRPSAKLRLFGDTVRLVAASPLPDRDRDLPIELLCLRPRVVESVARYDGPTAADVVALAVSPSGDRFATGGEDGTVTLRDGAGGVVATLGPGAPKPRLLFVARGLAVASADGRLTLLDTVTGGTLAAFAFDVPITDLATDAAGSILAAGCDDGTLRVIRPGADGRAAEPVVVTAHRRMVGAVAVSPDGSRMAATSRDGTTRLFDTTTGREIGSSPASRDRDGDVAFSPDGRRLASVGPRRSILLIDGESLASTGIPTGHTERIRSLAFSPDGALLATASDDGTATLHDVARRTRVATLVGHRGPVTTLAFSPDGTTLATASTDRTIRLWRPADGVAGRTLEGHEDPIAALAWAPDGRSLLSAGDDGLTLRWDTTTAGGARVIDGHDRPFDGVLFLPGSTRFLGHADDGSARLWDAATATEILRLPPRAGPLRAAAVSPDGAVIALGGDDDLVTLHDPRDGSRTATLRGHARRVTSLAFSPDGATLASASDDGTARLWNRADGTCRRVLAGHSDAILDVGFSPDGTRVATASRDGTARVWVVAAEGPGIELAGHSALVRTIAFSPDGRLVATGSDDGTARLWHAEGGACVATLRAGTSAVTRIAFVDGGRRLVSGSMRGGLDLWDVDGAAHVAPLEGHTGEIRAIAVTPDGTRFVTGSSDRTVRLWDAEDGAELLVLQGHSAAILGLALSADGRDLVTTSADRTVRLWSRTDAEIREARLRADRADPDDRRVADTAPAAP